MNNPKSVEWLLRQNAELAASNAELTRQLNQSKDHTLKSGGSDGGDGMNLLRYRMDQFEKRAEASDARMARIEDKLNDIQVTLAGMAAGLATKDNVRNWSIALAAIIIATGAAIAGLWLQASSNQLSAFQSGLSAIQAVTAAAQSGPAKPAAPQSKP